MRGGHLMENVQRDFPKFTAQKIKFFLQDYCPQQLKELEVNLVDRKRQIWQRNSLNVPLHTEQVFLQKLEYIHHNPVKAGLCQFAPDYEYSSASFYTRSDEKHQFLTHHAG